MGVRTKTTKEIERMTFEDLGTWSVIAGVSRELYRRYGAELWATAFFTVIAINIWQKLG